MTHTLRKSTNTIVDRESWFKPGVFECLLASLQGFHFAISETYHRNIAFDVSRGYITDEEWAGSTAYYDVIEEH